MPDQKLSQLPAGGPIGPTDLFYSVQGGNSVSQTPVAFSNYFAIPGFNVKNFGAVGNGTTDDTAAINAAIAALNAATRGILYFPAGTYLVTANLTAISANGIIAGEGSSNLINQFFTAGTPGTQINCPSTSVSPFTITSQQAMLRDIAIKNTAASTPVSGAGVVVTHPTNDGCTVDMYNVAVSGFFDCIDRQAGGLWTMDTCAISGPVRYGTRVRNINNVDTGDWSIINSVFYTGITNAPAAIQLESSGGGKISNIKTNGGPGSTVFTNPINVEGAGNTVDLQITNSSIENFSGTGIRLNGSWPNVSISNMEIGVYFGGGTRAITATNTAQLTISNIVLPPGHFSDAIDLTNVTDATVVNVLNGYVNGIPALTTTHRSNIATILGNGSQSLFQGDMALSSGALNQASGLAMTIGPYPPSASGATNFLTVNANNNDNIPGSLAKDVTDKIAGGGAWWLGFASNGDGGGTFSYGLKTAPIVAGGPSLTQFMGGASGSPTSAGWIQWGGEQRVTADVAYTSTVTLATVTGLSVPLQAGRTYAFEATLYFTDAAAGGIQAAVASDGTLTATNIIYNGWIVDSAANGTKGNTQATALGTAVASSTTTGTTGVVQIKGTITVNVAGTMNIQAAQNTSNGTATTIKRGSSLIVHDMP